MKIVRESNWSTVAVAAILPGVLAAIVEYIITQGVSGWVSVLVALIGGTVTMAVLRLMEQRRPPALPVQSVPFVPSVSPVPQIEGREWSPRTPAELVASIRGLTEIAAESASRRHIGLWLKVEGHVLDVSAIVHSKTTRVHIEESKDGVTLFLIFNAKRWGAQLTSFNVGDPISAIGEIEYIDRMGYVRLKECELVN